MATVVEQVFYHTGPRFRHTREPPRVRAPGDCSADGAAACGWAGPNSAGAVRSTGGGSQDGAASGGRACIPRVLRPSFLFMLSIKTIMKFNVLSRPGYLPKIF